MAAKDVKTGHTRSGAAYSASAAASVALAAAISESAALAAAAAKAKAKATEVRAGYTRSGAKFTGGHDDAQKYSSEVADVGLPTFAASDRVHLYKFEVGTRRVTDPSCVDLLIHDTLKKVFGASLVHANSNINSTGTLTSKNAWGRFEALTSRPVTVDEMVLINDAVKPCKLTEGASAKAADLRLHAVLYDHDPAKGHMFCGCARLKSVVYAFTGSYKGPYIPETHDGKVATADSVGQFHWNWKSDEAKKVMAAISSKPVRNAGIYTAAGKIFYSGLGFGWNARVD